MPEDSDDIDGFEKEIDRIFNEDDLDQAGVEFSGVLKTHAGKEIERIFNEGGSLEESQTKIVDLVRFYAEKALSKVTDEGAREQLIGKKVNGIWARIAEYAKEKKLTKEWSSNSQKSKLDSITPESKKNLKTLLKNFVIYEVYKVMNPRRIAGETKEINYKNNLITGDEKKADRYAGRHFSEQEKAQMRADVNREMASWGKSRGGTLSALDLEVGNPKIAKSEGSEKTRTVDALDLASSLRKSLEGSVNKSGLDEIRAKAREAMDQKKAQEARENKGPGKDKGGYGIG